MKVLGPHGHPGAVAVSPVEEGMPPEPALAPLLRVDQFLVRGKIQLPENVLQESAQVWFLFILKRVILTLCNFVLCSFSVDGSWSTWTPWTSCSQSCGPGSTTRTRSCSAPKAGGKPCLGKGQEVQDCETRKCLGR